MKNIKQWAGIALISIALVAAVCSLFLFIDSTCSPLTNEFCRQWTGFQWETVLAGALGLTGGIFVITSSREQIQAMRETTAQTIEQAKLHRADAACAPLMLAHQVTDRFRLWAEDRQVILNAIKARINSGSLDPEEFIVAINRIQNDLELRCKHVREILETHTTTTFNFEVSAALQRLSRSANVTNGSSQEFITHDDLQNRVLVISYRVQNAEAGARGARAMIGSQINEIRDRCGI